MTSHVPGQWPEALRTSPTRELLRQDHLRAAEEAWTAAVLAGAAAHLEVLSTPAEVRAAAARIAAQVTALAETVLQQADALQQ